MVKFPEIGKITEDVFNNVIYPHLGAKSVEILVGPQHGVDVGIVRVGNFAMALTTDPVFIVPEYGWERAAWFATHILVSDVVTSGLPPRYMSIDLNLPLSIKESEFITMWQVISEECEKMGIAIICGHTARYDNCNYPMVGGATVIAIGGLDEYVTPGFIKPGDKLIVTKGPAVEATGIFATMFPRLLSRTFGEDFAKKTEEIFFMMSTYRDAMLAVQIGVRDDGVSAMHDATECGIFGGVFELAQAASLGVRLNKDEIAVDERIQKVCDYFEIDPFKSISEGTLLIAVRPHKAELLKEHLESNGIRAFICGEFIPREYGFVLIENGAEKELAHPKVDPFWAAFYRALKSYSVLENEKNNLM